jgi:hypothetical protein
VIFSLPIVASRSGIAVFDPTVAACTLSGAAFEHPVTSAGTHKATPVQYAIINNDLGLLPGLFVPS